MKLTPALRKAINAAVRRSCGTNPCAEVGYRSIGPDGSRPVTNNALAWPEGSDLWDKTRLAAVKELDDDPLHPGYHELDLYVTTGSGYDRELETNVCILIHNGLVVGSTAHSLRVPALKAALNFPTGAGW